MDGWKFQEDAAGVGVSEGYWRPGLPEEGLADLRVDQFWDDQGYPGLKQGWYRLRYTCPALPDRKRVFLRFGAVDEAAWLYVDGSLVAWYESAYPALTWDKPVLLEVTGSLTGGQEHTFVVRVRNATKAGGLWRPITLLVEESPQ